MSEYMFCTGPHDIFYHLLRLSVKFPTATKPKFHQTKSFCFPTFPAEIVSRIFDSIDGENVGDSFALALTSERCWLIAQRHIKAIVLRHQIVWAGDRIICSGDDSEHGDLPKGLLSVEEESIYANEYGSIEEYCENTTPSNLFSFSPKAVLDEFVGGFRKQISYENVRRICLAVDIVFEEPEILRNISKRQYVRRAELVEMRKTCPKDWEFDDVDLGHVLISRICWSSDPSTTLSYKGPIHRGVWAGDRFDITSAAALEEKDENGQPVLWTDVSEEVLAELRCIWSSEYGEGVLINKTAGWRVMYIH